MGGKNKKDAEKSESAIKDKENKPLPKEGESVQSCPIPKHWFGIRVVDEAGKTIKDVAASVLLTDGSQLEVDFETESTLEKDGTWRTEKVLPAGDCEVSFPEIYNMEWWPLGGSAGNYTVDQTATVADGDCVVSIAAGLGFRDYQSVWSRSKNKDLKSKRTNANQLVPGDALFAPDQKDKKIKKATDAVWTFVVKTKKPAKLKLLIVDKDLKPVSGKAWELLSPVVASGTTGGDGVIEFKEIPLDQNSAQLKLKLVDPPPPLDPVPPPTGPQKYPPEVNPTQYLDKDPAKLINPTVEWDLKVGSLHHFDELKGIQARLHNLGFGCEPEDDDATTTRAVKAYQLFFQNNKNGSGVAKDIAANLRDRHDK